MLCNICKNIDALCKVCEEGFREGRISLEDIQISRDLARRDIEADFKAFNLGPKIVVFGIKYDDFKKKTVTILPGMDKTASLKMIISPVKFSKTTVFKDGEETGRIRLPKETLLKEGFKIDELKKALDYLDMEVSL